MACDVCGKSEPGEQLQALRACYQQPGIVWLCSTCIKLADCELDRLRNASHRWIDSRLKRAMLCEKRAPGHLLGRSSRRIRRFFRWKFKDSAGAR